MFCRGEYQDREPANPAVILLDLKLPKVDGLQVLERIKADPGIRGIPIVMLSSSHEETDLVRSYNLGQTPTLSNQLISTILCKRLES